MNQLTLDEIKQVELQLLKKFKCFCDDNNIKYFLSNGTLLGAIKYKGFIPWDDDVDVFVPREDYNKLISLFKDNSIYSLFAFERNQNFRFPFAKFCDMSTYKKETNIDNGVNLGIDIDIFPLDSWGNDFNSAKRDVKRIKRNIFFLNLSKLEKTDSVHLIKRIIKKFLIFFCKLIGSRYFIRKIVNDSISEEQKCVYYKGCKSWCIYGEREIIPAEVFSDTIDVEFEGEQFSAPIGYDIYLRCLYGDYENDPPIDKQKTHHCFNAYRL